MIWNQRTAKVVVAHLEELVIQQLGVHQHVLTRQGAGHFVAFLLLRQKHSYFEQQQHLEQVFEKHRLVQDFLAHAGHHGKRNEEVIVGSVVVREDGVPHDLHICQM